MTRDFASMCVCVRALAQLHKAAAYKQVFGAAAHWLAARRAACAYLAVGRTRVSACECVCVQCANTKTTSRVCAQQPETEKEIEIGAHQCSRPAEMLASMHPNFKDAHTHATIYVHSALLGACLFGPPPLVSISPLDLAHALDDAGDDDAVECTGFRLVGRR